MTLHMAVKAVADGNETCTAGRLDDCAFVGASAVEFLVACLLRNSSSKMCFFVGCLRASRRSRPKIHYNPNPYS